MLVPVELKNYIDLYYIMSQNTERRLIESDTFGNLIPEIDKNVANKGLESGVKRDKNQCSGI